MPARRRPLPAFPQGRLSALPALAWLPLAAAGASLALAAGCAAPAGGSAAAGTPLTLTVETITLRMAADVNDRWPVPVELVRVADPAAREQLLAMNADDWFGSAGEAFRVANTDALYDSWELVPGTTAGPFDVRVAGRHGGVLFCDLRGEEPQLAVPFERDGDVLVSVSDEGCTLAGGCASRRAGLLSVSWGGRTCTGRALARPATPTRVREVSFEVAAGANDNWPVSVDLVRTPDGALIDRLLDMDTRTWFGKEGEEFRNANPDVRYDSWEVVPGTVAGPYDVRHDGRVGGLVFCNVAGSFGPIDLGDATAVVVDIDSGGGCDVRAARSWSW